MGWTGAYPTLSRKKPTASLVSRKVLTPLLGQVAICVLTQLVGLEAVRRQLWYSPIWEVQDAAVNACIGSCRQSSTLSIQTFRIRRILPYSCYLASNISYLPLSLVWAIHSGNQSTPTVSYNQTLSQTKLIHRSSLCCYHRCRRSLLVLHVAGPSKSACQFNATDVPEHRLQTFLDSACSGGLCLRMGDGAPYLAVDCSHYRESAR